MKRKKTLDGFNLSFMDCICCGFGAIILLFVLTVGPIKKTLETKKTGVQDYLDQITKALGILESQLEGDKAKIKKIESANTNLYSKEIIQTFEDLSELEAQISSIEKKLDDKQNRIDEIALKMSLQTIPSSKLKDTSPVGVTTESDHVAFLIDTSGSMRTPLGPIQRSVLNQIEKILNAYPKVKGFQILDTYGNYILSGTKKNWIPDSQQNRMRIVRALQNYPLASISDPSPGLLRFFKDYKQDLLSDKKIGLYIFGDEFPNVTSKVLKRVQQWNPKDPTTGKHKVTINAVGFPFRLENPLQANQTGYKFAHLMRQLTHQNGGAFMTIN